MTNAENATTTPDGTATASQTIAISGASGMVGTTLSDVLRHSGHSVISMSRKVSDSDNSSIVSNPASGLKTPTQLEGVGTVIHLAGENIAAGRATLPLNKMRTLANIPGISWSEEDVSREYKKLAARIGMPKYVVTDGASELRER